MANNIGKQNYLVVEINPTTHETKSIPFDKCYIYDNVLFSDFYEDVEQTISKLAKIDVFEDIVKQYGIAITELTNMITSTNAKVEEIFKMLKGDKE